MRRCLDLFPPLCEAATRVIFHYSVKLHEAVCEIAVGGCPEHLFEIHSRFVDVKVAYHWRPMHPLKKRSVSQKSSRKDLPTRQGAIPRNLPPVGALDERGCLSSKATLDVDNSATLKAENSVLISDFTVNPEPG
ncbi:hypothetical protein Nepgr_016444 [Nepenthes gracilis]|uniref:Uncharacterized protein n=1 Tax=Nepenthes gracilis TaxID=150966 RepID=A0AAD3SNK0_NEPGR|nr:hypothetical protein Nepgr_016444 [Nepenthes gracilis]